MPDMYFNASKCIRSRFCTVLSSPFIHLCKFTCAGFLVQSMRARKQIEIGFSYRPARLQRLAESIPGLRKSLKIPALGPSLHPQSPSLYPRGFSLNALMAPHCILRHSLYPKPIYCIPRTIHYTQVKKFVGPELDQRNRVGSGLCR